jgi:hypothetical protein
MNGEIYYCPGENNFYLECEKYLYTAVGTWPNDLRHICEADALVFLGLPPAGKMRAAGLDGMPQWVEEPELTVDQRIHMAEQSRFRFRVIADVEIAWRQDAVDTGIASEQEMSDLTQWKKYRVALMRVDMSNPNWPPIPLTMDA